MFHSIPSKTLGLALSHPLVLEYLQRDLDSLGMSYDVLFPSYLDQAGMQQMLQQYSGDLLVTEWSHEACCYELYDLPGTKLFFHPTPESILSLPKEAKNATYVHVQKPVRLQPILSCLGVGK